MDIITRSQGLMAQLIYLSAMSSTKLPKFGLLPQNQSHDKWQEAKG